MKELQIHILQTQERYYTYFICYIFTRVKQRQVEDIYPQLEDIKYSQYVHG